MHLDHRFVLGVVAALAVCLLTACGGGAASPTPTIAAPSPAGAAPAPSPARPALASPAPSPSPAVSSSSSSSSPSPVATVDASAQTYEIQAGDTLATISQQFYGDPTQWRRIYDANKDTIGADPDKLKLGTKLTIPPKQS